MSQLFVDNIKNRTGGAIGAPSGIVVTGVSTLSGNGIKVLAGGINAVGVVTATSFSGDGSALTGVESWNQFDTWLYGGG